MDRERKSKTPQEFKPLVYSLNSYVDGVDKLEGLLGADLEAQLDTNSNKWPHESKATVSQLRTANCIINEGASLCKLDTYVICTDWLKHFNQSSTGSVATASQAIVS